jgi:hypothetical protein
MKEVALDEKTMHRLVEFGVKTALATLDSDAGKKKINKAVGEDIDFWADLTGR